mmetsp:Transcript_87613/g.246099  ORF Transcript_87613/g.246099 Transcript_87613/m.246099 type:complete len:371 (-) Transcript_87613:84-1196(-)
MSRHSFLGADSKGLTELVVHVEQHEETVSTNVLFVCSAVIALLTCCWGVYGMASKVGHDAKLLKLMLLCLSFAACSWGMNVLNKALVHTLQAPSLVTAAQMLMTIVGTLLLARDKLTFEPRQVLKWSFVPFLFFGMLVSSFFTYEYLTLSMLMLIRNLSPMVTVPIERCVMPADKQPPVTKTMLLALLTILAGAIVYSGNIELSRVGFAFAMLNMVLAIADRVAQRRLLTSECKDLTTETCVLLNNLVGLVPTAILGAATGETAKFDVHLWFGSRTTFLLLLSGFIGTGICYFAIAVQREISATSFMVLQNAARMGVVAAGVGLFHDPLKSVWQGVGILLSFLGALWYGQNQLSASRQERQKRVEAKTEK